MSAPESPPNSHGANLSAAAALVIVFGTSFAALALLPVDVPVYVPLEHRWMMGFPQKPAIGMDFFGRAMVSLALGILAAGAAWALSRFAVKWDPEKNPGAVRALALYSFLSVGFSLFIYAYTLLFR